MTGFRATVAVSDPESCPVAGVTATTEEPAESVTWTRAGGENDDRVVEEFTLPTDNDPSPDDVETDLTPVQANEHETVYRFERERDVGCACEVVEESGTPVSSVSARDGAVLLSFRTLELEELAGIVDGLRERFEGVLVEELTEDPSGESVDPVVVDRGALTDRQREILETAHEMGYFEYPKGANATDVAAELGVARSTFTEHLAAAQTKLMDGFLEK
ncbi:helix-turn-helix domain-containing protein [Natrialba swarupiae]|uniref:Bacterio-opsin activator n=1 Tax=Natrialba swarupiae TaxID=2448032 RepID=A0A5D5AHH3_9EURY|nr:helix-turn-helix domain-containing protein [Natrialba swarupiae]TYT61176.1 bacterio-opsin activator [Natrialba swarupiae]